MIEHPPSRSRRRRAAISIVVALALGAADCGGAPSLSPDPGADTPTAAAGEPQAPSILASVDDLPAGFERVFERWTGDLDGMAKRRAIRLLTVFSPMQFFLDGPEPRGIVYESAGAFERVLNGSLGTGRLPVRIVIVPVLRSDLIPALVEGRGDLAAANLTITPERLEQVDFSEPVLTGVRELVVTRKDGPALLEERDLAGLEIHVRRSSSYHDSLIALNARLTEAGETPVTIVDMPEHLEDDDILEMVGAGLLPATVVDSHKAEFWSRTLDGILVHPQVAVRTGGEIGWAFRKDSPLLAEQVNRFVRAHRKGTLFGNVVFNRYLDEDRGLYNALDAPGRLRLDGLAPLFQKFGDRYDLDWLLLAAQAYQESHLDQSRRSSRGAVGVMQLLPSTAADLGVPDIEDVEHNIEAGAKYLRWILDTYFDDDTIEPDQKPWFALAAYNAGPARVRALRAEASRANLDPAVWIDNVEVIAARRIGAETVRYVANIARYWIAYHLFLERGRIVDDANASG